MFAKPAALEKHSQSPTACMKEIRRQQFPAAEYYNDPEESQARASILGMGRIDTGWIMFLLSAGPVALKNLIDAHQRRCTKTRGRHFFADLRFAFNNLAQRRLTLLI